MFERPSSFEIDYRPRNLLNILHNNTPRFLFISVVNAHHLNFKSLRNSGPKMCISGERVSLVVRMRLNGSRSVRQGRFALVRIILPSWLI